MIRQDAPVAARLTVQQRQELAGLLAGQLARRRQQLATRQDQASFVEHATAERQQDGDDVMMRNGEREVDALLADRDHLEVACLSAALERIKATDYGICADCGKPIGFARLLVQPEALCCSACEALREQRAQADSRR